jgi:RimJ/RimL family protein N-acetyltransferase
MNIRLAKSDDFERIWSFFRDIVSQADTYAIDQNISYDDAKTLWMDSPIRTYVYEEDGVIYGSYYVKKNQNGPGSHVCNCGYMVSSAARGKGIATTMCKHSQEIAIDLGFNSMQFNAVVSTNVGAITLWEKLGFEIVGTVPKAFNHPKNGYIDIHIMHKLLR